MKRDWTMAEIKYLKESYKAHADISAIAEQLGRSKGAVHTKISQIGIAIPTKTKFPRGYKKYLKDNYQSMTNQQLADALGCTLTVLRYKLYEMGLRRYSAAVEHWTAEENKILLDNYQTKTNIDIARMLFPKQDKKSVAKRLKQLKLKRTPEQEAAISAENLKRFKANSFRPGECRYKNNPEKAWRTRRQNAQKTHSQIINEINRRIAHVER